MQQQYETKSLVNLAFRQALLGAGQWAQCLWHAANDLRPVNEVFLERHPTSVHKAAVGAASGSTPHTSVLAPSSFSGALATYADELSILGRFMGFALQVPFGASVNEASAMTGSGWITGGSGAVVLRGTFDSAVLGPCIHAAITVVTQDLLRFSDGRASRTVAQILARACAEAIDRDFVDPTNTGTALIKPASIFAQGSPVLTASGTDATAARADLLALISEFRERDNRLSRALLIMRSDTACALAMFGPPFDQLTVTGGSLFGMPVLAGDHVSAIIGLVDPGKVVVSADDGIQVDLARDASLEMDDSPSQHSVTPVPSNVVSLWASNSVAFRAVRAINWDVLGSAAVYIDDVAYGGSGSPA